MFADDTSLAYASNSIDDITKGMDTELENLKKMATWKQANFECY